MGYLYSSITKVGTRPSYKRFILQNKNTFAKLEKPYISITDNKVTFLHILVLYKVVNLNFLDKIQKNIKQHKMVGFICISKQYLEMIRNQLN